MNPTNLQLFINNIDPLEAKLTYENLNKMILERNNENSNTSFTPETLNMSVSGYILQQYALSQVFSKRVAEAHIKGDIHLHDLTTVTRPYCSGNSPAYVIKNGLKLNGIKTVSAPAKHALTLCNHLSAFTNYLQCYFSGAIGFDAVNMFFAPFIENLSDNEVKQVAQHLIFSFAQLAGARGGQTAFTDFNMYLNVPPHYENTYALLPGGIKSSTHTYKHYEYHMRRFLKAILLVLDEGDANKANFAFPKILVHLNKYNYNRDDELLDLVCKVNSKRGSVYIIYDRSFGAKISMCCRLSLDMDEQTLSTMLTNPEEVRFCALQNVTINLPRLAYISNSMDELKSNITNILDLIMEAHINKRDFIKKLLDQGENGILGFLAKGMDGNKYLDLSKVKYLIGMCGLNEMVMALTHKFNGIKISMHEDDKALELGLYIMAYIYHETNRLAKQYGLECLLEETPAESSIPADTKVYVAHKYNDAFIFDTTTISSLFDKTDGLTEELNSSIIKYPSQNLFCPSVNKNGKIELKKIKAIIKKPHKNCVTYTLENENSFTLTKDHNFYILDENLNIKLANYDDIVVNQTYVCVPISLNYIKDYDAYAKENIEEVEYDKGFVLAALTHFKVKNEKLVGYFNVNNKPTLDLLSNKLEKLMISDGYNVKKYRNIRNDKGKEYLAYLPLSTLNPIKDLIHIKDKKIMVDYKAITNKDVACGFIETITKLYGYYLINDTNSVYYIKIIADKYLDKPLTIACSLANVNYTKTYIGDICEFKLLPCTSIRYLFNPILYRAKEASAVLVPYVSKYIGTILKFCLENELINFTDLTTIPFTTNFTDLLISSKTMKRDHAKSALHLIKSLQQDKLTKYQDIINKLDMILSSDLDFLKVIDKKESDYTGPLYDLSIEDNENFMIGEARPLLVHNTSGRLAKLDTEHFKIAYEYVKGYNDEYYYTNSVHFAYDANIDILDRIKKQSKFTYFIKAGSIIHNWLGQLNPEPNALKNLYEFTLFETNAQQTADSPEFTVCRSCSKTFKGLYDKCPQCNSLDIYSETRITGYFSPISSWTKSKISELKDRLKGTITNPIVKNNILDKQVYNLLLITKPDCPKCTQLKKYLKDNNITVDIYDISTPEGLSKAALYDVSEFPAMIFTLNGLCIKKVEGSVSFIKFVKECAHIGGNLC